MTLRTTGHREQREQSSVTLQAVVERAADPLGRRWYNNELSKSRATNALQALRDCTAGEGIKAESELGWHGERLLELLDRFFDFPDTSPRPEWRRVFVLLNITVALNLWVRDPKDV